MKRGTLTHPKVDRLMWALDIERAAAIGHLEALWHFTATHAPQGNVGRWTDEEIASACFFVGDAHAFIEGLLRAVWIQTHDGARLIVHDWYEHADDGVHMALARKGLRFASGEVPKMHRFSQQDRMRMACAYRAHKKRTALPCPPLPFPARPEEKKKLALARKEKATTWPQNFTLTDALRAFAEEGGLDAELEFQKFKDHALMNGVRHVDWVRAFRYWCRNAVEFAARRARR